MQLQFRSLIQKHKIRFMLLLSGMIVSLFLTQFAYAATGKGLGDVAQNVLNVFETVANAIAAAAYIAGIGFGIGAIMKFKQHKDNPTQIPIGTPIALLFIAVALVFLPTIIKVTGETLFAGEGKVGGPKGTGVKILEGQGSSQ